MRRLGFLEILVSDCSSSIHVATDSLGSTLWSSVREKQDEWLAELGITRGLRGPDVGKITPRTTERFVKLATELGLLTDGPLKALTDLGRLFRLFRKKAFFINSNLGQQIILIKEFLMKDALIFPRIIEYIVKSKTSTTAQVFNWFVNDFIRDTIVQTKEILDPQLLERFLSTLDSYNSEEPRTRRRGYDRVKHIIAPRLENIVDLEIMSKRAGPMYVCSNRTMAIYEHICQPSIQGKELRDDDIYQGLADIYGVSKRASPATVLKETLIGFNALAEPPLKVVPTKILRDFVSIDSIVSGRFVILPEDAEKIEEFLSRKFYGKVVFFEDREGRVSHISIPDEIREKILANLDEYASQIGD